MLHLYIDADACPVKQEIYRVAERYGLPVTVVANSRMGIPDQAGVSLQVVAGDLDAADDWIAEHVEAHDIVITADIPLASRCLAKGAHVLGTTGKPFTDDNIGDALATRELLADLRITGEITGGPPPLTKKDRSTFLHQLDEMVQKVRRKVGGPPV
ncbi:MAG: YaiI/YqxD family protein [Acidobacteria bacterium]|nr:YaiI/YqxD family protein [Acidobacteriota bacterium]